MIEFETEHPDLQGEMTVTCTLRDAGSGTDPAAAHEDVPPGVPPSANELGWSISMGKLVRTVESRLDAPHDEPPTGRAPGTS